MNKRQHHLEQMIALTLIAYNLGMLIGEALRDVTYGHLKPNQLQLSLAGKLGIDLQEVPKMGDLLRLICLAQTEITYS